MRRFRNYCDYRAWRSEVHRFLLSYTNGDKLLLSAKSGRWGSETSTVSQMMDANIVCSNAWYCTAVHLVAHFDKQDLHLYLAIPVVNCFK